MEQTQQNKRTFKLMLDFEKETFQIIGEITAKEMLDLVQQYNLYEWRLITSVNPVIATNRTVKKSIDNPFEVPFDSSDPFFLPKPTKFVKPSQHPFLSMKSKFIDDDTFNKLSKEEQERIINAEKEHEQQINNVTNKESETDDSFISNIMFSNTQKDK